LSILPRCLAVEILCLFTANNFPKIIVIISDKKPFPSPVSLLQTQYTLLGLRIQLKGLSLASSVSLVGFLSQQLLTLSDADSP
jgi:hypothetical protein